MFVAHDYDSPGVHPPYYNTPVETMAFNLYAMSEARKDQLNELAQNLVLHGADTYATQYLTQSEIEYVLNRCRNLRESDNYNGGKYGYYGF